MLDELLSMDRGKSSKYELNCSDICPDLVECFTHSQSLFLQALRHLLCLKHIEWRHDEAREGADKDAVKGHLVWR